MSTYEGTVVRAPIQPSDKVVFLSILEPNAQKPVQLVLFTASRSPELVERVINLTIDDEIEVIGRREPNKKTGQEQIVIDTITYKVNADEMVLPEAF